MAIKIGLDVRNQNGASLGVQCVDDIVTGIKAIERVPAVAMVGVPGFGIVTIKGDGRYSWYSWYVNGKAGGGFVEGDGDLLREAIGVR